MPINHVTDFGMLDSSAKKSKMPIPDYQTVMLPFLKVLGDGEVHHVRSVIERLATEFKLSAEELEEKIPSGLAFLFDNRVGWGRTYLKKAGLIESSKRGEYRITKRGTEVLASKPAKIDVGLLRRYPEFQEFYDSDRTAEDQATKPEASEPQEDRTPLEVLEGAHQRLRRELADELLQTVRNASPAFFERLVVDVLVKMGYGGSRKDAGKAVGRSGDDGVDGIINEDRLGLDKVYVQAKRWTAVVGRPDVQGFVGSLEGRRARKGVFITTSQFSKDAKEYVTRIEKNIVLIDGEELAQLMIDSDVGVADVGSYNVKRLDRDYFEE
jgi:restriction system protein